MGAKNPSSSRPRKEEDLLLLLARKQEEFENELFPKARKPRESEERHRRSQQQRQQRQHREQSIEDPRKRSETEMNPPPLDQQKAIDESGPSSNFLYNTRRTHPIVEYMPSSEESASSSLTPSFVLEVTWPRMVQFYHPLSPRCISFQPTYVTLARDIKRRSSRMPVEFHAVNCHVHREVCERGFDVHSVPTMIGLRSGRIDWEVIAFPPPGGGALVDGDAVARGGGDGGGGIVDYTSADDVGGKVEHLARVMGIPLDAAARGARSSDVGFARGGDGGDGTGGDGGDVAITRASSNERGPPPGVSSSDARIPPSERVFHDAMSSLLVALTASLPPRYAPGGASPPDDRALSEFLDLIRWAYPPESRVHDMAEDIRLDYDNAMGSEMGLLNALSRHSDLDAGISWSARCGTTDTNGRFNCGLWSLLHTLSIGVAERHASVVGVGERVSVIYAGSVIRTFIKQFYFGCTSCRDTWIQLYDDKCRDGNDMVPWGKKSDGSGNVDEWRRLAIWIWEIHNEVTVRRDELAWRGYVDRKNNPRMAPSSSLWPTEEECPKCWISLTDDTGMVMNMYSYDKDQLYNHLKRIYWPGGIHNNRLIVLDRWNGAKRALSARNLRARMASHDSPISMSIVLSLLLYVILRTWRCFSGGRPLPYKGHRNKRSNDSLQNPEEEWKRNPHHSAFLKSRSRKHMHTLEQPAPKRYDSREEESHLFTKRLSNIRPHEGNSRFGGPGSKSVKKNDFNRILNL